MNGDDLSLNDNNVPVVRRKNPWRYVGKMSGLQNRAIRLTIGSITVIDEVSGAYYQYYNSRRGGYGDLIILTGRLA